jgi:hypothetical protein
MMRTGLLGLGAAAIPFGLAKVASKYDYVDLGQHKVHSHYFRINETIEGDVYLKEDQGLLNCTVRGSVYIEGRDTTVNACVVEGGVDIMPGAVSRVYVDGNRIHGTATIHRGGFSGFDNYFVNNLLGVGVSPSPSRADGPFFYPNDSNGFIA